MSELAGVLKGGLRSAKSAGRRLAPGEFLCLWVEADELGEWMQNLGELGDHPSVKPDHAQEAAELCGGLGGWEVLDLFDFMVWRADAVDGDVVAQEVDLLLEELTFVECDLQMVLVQESEDGCEIC